jgi:hypothetical protein
MIWACPQGSGFRYSLFLFCHPERSREAIILKQKRAQTCRLIPHAKTLVFQFKMRKIRSFPKV